MHLEKGVKGKGFRVMEATYRGLGKEMVPRLRRVASITLYPIPYTLLSQSIGYVHAGQ